MLWKDLHNGNDWFLLKARDRVSEREREREREREYNIVLIIGNGDLQPAFSPFSHYPIKQKVYCLSHNEIVVWKCFQ